MSEVGALVVKLTAETAQFREDLGKVKGQLNDLKGGASSAGDGIAKSMTSSRESVMLLSEDFGVHMPRALSMFISKLGGVAAVMEVAFPIIGIVAVIEMVAKLIEKHEALANAIRKSADESAKADVKHADETKSIELTNLKLDDQIAKLERKPSHNYMAEAILETSKDVDELLASYSADMQKMTALTESQTGVWMQAWRAAKDVLSNEFGPSTVGSTTKQWDDLKQKMLEVQEAQGKLATTNPFDKGATAAAQQNVIDKLNAEKASLSSLQITYRGNKDELLQLGAQYNSVTSELHNLNLTIDEGSKKRTIAGLNQNKENLEPLKQKAELHQQLTEDMKAEAAAVNKLAQTEASASGESLANIHKNHDATVQAANDELTHLRQQYDLDIAAAGNDANEKSKIEEKYRHEVVEQNIAIVQADTEAANKTVELTRKAAEESVRIKQQAAQEELQAAKAAVESEKAFTSSIAEYEKKEIANSVAQGILSRRQALIQDIAISKQETEAKIKDITDELHAKEAAIQKEIDADKAAAAAALAASGGNTQDTTYLQYLDTAKIKQQQLDDLIKKTQTDINAVWVTGQTALSGYNQQLQASTTFSGAFHAKMAELNQDSKNLAATMGEQLAQSVNQFETGMANAMAKSIVEGKNFGQAMRQVAGEFLENMISALIKSEIQHLITDKVKLASTVSTNAAASADSVATDSVNRLSAAKTAAAKAMTTVPFPFDLVVAPLVFAAALAFADGGVVPGYGSGDTVPAMLTPGESVVTKALTDRVNQSEGKGGTSTMHIHNHINATAMDAEGVDRVLTKHMTTLQRHVTSQIRRQNKR